jgi:hypothetical protein
MISEISLHGCLITLLRAYSEVKLIEAGTCYKRGSSPHDRQKEKRQMEEGTRHTPFKYMLSLIPFPNQDSPPNIPFSYELINGLSLQ